MDFEEQIIFDMKYIIEHCEPKISLWLELEYRHCTKIIPRTQILFTNVTKKEDKKKLSYTNFTEKTAAEICGSEKVLVLDPKAKKELQTRDFKKFKKIIIGGILGDEKPRGRTSELLTKKLNCEARHIGKFQLSVDGACFVARKIQNRKKLSEIEIVNFPELVFSENYSEILGYAIPFWEGKPVFTPGILRYLIENDII